MTQKRDFISEVYAAPENPPPVSDLIRYTVVACVFASAGVLLGVLLCRLGIVPV